MSEVQITNMDISRSYVGTLYAKQIKLPAEGALLPAEERLQNVLKAIEDRLRYEKGEWEQMLRELDMGIWTEDSPELAKQRSFIQGLDIAWSLAQTEILRRG